MEENVALDTAKQKKFEKSIKGIKKIIKNTETEPKVEVDVAKREKRKRKDRGLVYLSHIPHGFYENAMTQYCKQFGVVTNARVVRSRRTGASRGAAFVEFREPAVAQIVADTMNNYLMGKRLIKAVYIPPEKQRPKAMRKHWSSTHNPAAELRLKMKKAYNANKDEKGELQRAKKILANFIKTKEKLSEIGIKYDFFVPVDMPEELADKLGSEVTTVKNEAGVKAAKEKKSITDKKEIKKESDTATEKKTMMVNNNEKTGAKQVAIKCSGGKQAGVDVKKQTNKKQINVKGMKRLEDFVKLQEDSEDSEGSEQFDSDEFEKMLANEDDSASEDALLNEDDDDESEDDQSDDESTEDVPLKKNKSKLGQTTPRVQPQQNKQPQGKRVAAQSMIVAAAVSPKKSKFEKQIKQKSNTKQFKKKK